MEEVRTQADQAAQEAPVDGRKVIPLLTAQDIECRVQGVSRSKGTGRVGAVLLLYKDARVDMRILDQVFGPGNWQRTHEVINGNLFCNIDIWDTQKGAWVRKQDVGVESNTEKEKGQASDAFKRAGFNVGIGRELYTAPFVYVELADKVFQTITVDNGVEFSDCERMERSCRRKGRRTKIYYCHPYSSYERGTNENINIMIRRWFPKGTDFGKITAKAIQAVEDWLNEYPRGILGFMSANDVFAEGVAALSCQGQ